MLKRCYFYSHFSDHPFRKGIICRSPRNWLLSYSDGPEVDGPSHQPYWAHSHVTHYCK